MGNLLKNGSTSGIATRVLKREEGGVLARSSKACCFATWSPNIILLWSLVPFKFIEPWSSDYCSPEPLSPKTRTKVVPVNIWVGNLKHLFYIHLTGHSGVANLNTQS